MKSLEELLSPIEGDSPTGEDMDDSQEFESLRTAFDINFPIDVGLNEVESDDLMPEAVSWDGIAETIEALSDQTKDLFLSISYARCGLVLGDIEMVERGLMYTAGLLETYWDEVHPTIESLDYRGRASLCEGLAGRGAFAMPFLNMAVVKSGRVGLTAEQLTDAFNNGPSSDAYPTVRRVLDDTDDELKLALKERLESLHASVVRIKRVMDDKRSGDAPDFSVLLDTFDVVMEAYLGLAGLDDGASGDGTEVDADSVEAGAARGSGAVAVAFTGRVQSRDDVIRALTEIEDYYTRAEPGHPVKVASARLRGWVTKDFMEILNDIVPDSVRDAERVLLERRDDD